MYTRQHPMLTRQHRSGWLTAPAKKDAASRERLKGRKRPCCRHRRPGLQMPGRRRVEAIASSVSRASSSHRAPAARATAVAEPG